MKKIGLLVLIACLAASVFSVEEEDGVLVLTDDNFDDVVKNNEFILVEFYAPWCGYCQRLEPEYAKAAQTLKAAGDQIKLAKVDATVNEKLAERFEVQGFPTLRFFRSGSPSEYTGGRTEQDIVSWVRRKSGPPARSVSTVEEAKNLIDSANVVVIGFFKDAFSSAAQNYITVAANAEDVIFGISSNSDVLSEYKISGDRGIVLFKKFDDGRADYSGDFNPQSISDFVLNNELPLVVELNEDTMGKVFGGAVRNHYMLFAHKANAETEGYLATLRKIAPTYANRARFVLVDPDVPSTGRIVAFFDINTEALPEARLIKLGDQGGVDKFQPEKLELTETAIQQFLDNYFAGKLKPFLKSEVRPDDWDAKPVKVLVGTSHDEVVNDATKDVLVEYYAPWCGHCKSLAPIYDELAEELAKEEPNVVVAKMDGTTNEVEGLQVAGFPTIKFYPAGANKTPIDYEDDRTVEAFKSFIQKNKRSGSSGAAEAIREQKTEL